MPIRRSSVLVLVLAFALMVAGESSHAARRSCRQILTQYSARTLLVVMAGVAVFASRHTSDRQFQLDVVQGQERSSTSATDLMDQATWNRRQTLMKYSRYLRVSSVVKETRTNRYVEYTANKEGREHLRKFLLLNRNLGNGPTWRLQGVPLDDPKLFDAFISPQAALPLRVGTTAGKPSYEETEKLATELRGQFFENSWRGGNLDSYIAELLSQRFDELTRLRAAGVTAPGYGLDDLGSSPYLFYEATRWDWIEGAESLRLLPIKSTLNSIRYRRPHSEQIGEWLIYTLYKNGKDPVALLWPYTDDGLYGEWEEDIRPALEKNPELRRVFFAFDTPGISTRQCLTDAIGRGFAKFADDFPNHTPTSEVLDAFLEQLR